MLNEFELNERRELKWYEYNDDGMNEWNYF